MKLILNKINKGHLRDLVLNSEGKTTEVLAAVAYATDAKLLFDSCWKNNIPLKYYGRLDAGIAVSIDILDKFLNKSPTNSVCKLVEHHHAKVIWWRGYGVYIGSANLTSSAWHNNIEAGCFFPEKEIDDDMEYGLFALFEKLEENSTPLNDEVITAMQKRSKTLAGTVPDANEFWDSAPFKRWDGLSRITDKEPPQIKRAVFLQEWHDTLDDLRKIGKRVSQKENRPEWVNATASTGAQADQFLHAHYYQRVVKGNKSYHEYFFEQNKTRREEALAEAIKWWQVLPEAPDKEDIMLNETAPFLKKALSKEALFNMDEAAFHEICKKVHAITNYARRASNESIDLPSDGTLYKTPQKIEALAKTIWNDQSAEGKHVKDLLNFILYGGEDDELSKRLWQGFNESTWKIKGLDIGSLGEMVGWARPDKFPPRNGRTSKALKSLGYDVEIY